MIENLAGAVNSAAGVAAPPTSSASPSLGGGSRGFSDVFDVTQKNSGGQSVVPPKPGDVEENLGGKGDAPEQTQCDGAEGDDTLGAPPALQVEKASNTTILAPGKDADTSSQDDPDQIHDAGDGLAQTLDFALPVATSAVSPDTGEVEKSEDKKETQQSSNTSDNDQLASLVFQSFIGALFAVGSDQSVQNLTCTDDLSNDLPTEGGGEVLCSPAGSDDAHSNITDNAPATSADFPEYSDGTTQMGGGADSQKLALSASSGPVPTDYPVNSASDDAKPSIGQILRGETPLQEWNDSDSSGFTLNPPTESLADATNTDQSIKKMGSQPGTVTDVSVTTTSLSSSVSASAAASSHFEKGAISLDTYLTLDLGSLPEMYSSESGVEEDIALSGNQVFSENVGIPVPQTKDDSTADPVSNSQDGPEDTAGLSVSGMQSPVQPRPASQEEGKGGGQEQSDQSATFSSDIDEKKVGLEADQGMPRSASFEQHLGQSSLTNEGQRSDPKKVGGDATSVTKKPDASHIEGGLSHVTGLSVKPSDTASDGTTLSMTVKTANSSEVKVKVSNEGDGVSTVVLQGDTEATVHELKKNHGDLLRALDAAGVNTAHMKIEVIASDGSNPDPSGSRSDQNNMMDWSGGGFSGNGQNGQRNADPQNIASNLDKDYPILGEASSEPVKNGAGSSGKIGSTNSGVNITV